MARRQWSWTELQNKRAKKVKAVVDGLRRYWPLTLRQIYYQLVSQGDVSNNRSQYIMLSKLIKWMRIDNMLPWNALEDRSRTITGKRGFENLEAFVEQETEGFLEGYTRCLVQGQDKYIEVWTEKDALFRIFDEVVWPYCIRAVICRGYSSVTFIADFFNRAEQAIMKGQQPVVLYFGDLDPSGVQMLEATVETLEDEMGLYGVQFKRIALNPDQIANLPSDPTAAKKTDPRYKSFKAKFGDVAVELDALHPKNLENMIRAAIEREIDMEKFKEQKAKEYEDEDRLYDIREGVKFIIEQEIPGMFY